MEKIKYSQNMKKIKYSQPELVEMVALDLPLVFRGDSECTDGHSEGIGDVCPLDTDDVDP